MKTKREKLLTRWGHLRSEKGYLVVTLARSDNIFITEKWTIFVQDRNKGHRRHNSIMTILVQEH